MEELSALEESPRGSIKRNRTEVSYNESLADADLEAQLRLSEAAGRGKRTRKAVSYEHAYLIQDWDDDDLEEDEAAYQQTNLRRGRPALNVSLYEVNRCQLSLYLSDSLCSRHRASCCAQNMRHAAQACVAYCLCSRCHLRHLHWQKSLLRVLK